MPLDIYCFNILSNLYLCICLVITLYKNIKNLYQTVNLSACINANLLSKNRSETYKKNPFYCPCELTVWNWGNTLVGSYRPVCTPALFSMVWNVSTCGIFHVFRGRSWWGGAVLPEAACEADKLWGPTRSRVAAVEGSAVVDSRQLSECQISSLSRNWFGVIFLNYTSIFLSISTFFILKKSETKSIHVCRIYCPV